MTPEYFDKLVSLDPENNAALDHRLEASANMNV